MHILDGGNGNTCQQYHLSSYTSTILKVAIQGLKLAAIDDFQLVVNGGWALAVNTGGWLKVYSSDSFFSKIPVCVASGDFFAQPSNSVKLKTFSTNASQLCHCLPQS